MIRKNIYIKMVGMAFASLTILGCADEWDDHYEGSAEGVTQGNLWEAISSNADLSNFKRVLEATGYNVPLAGSQQFTVFAPTNTELTDAKVEEILKQYQEDKVAGVKDKENRAIKRFVKNHIALYNYSVAKSGSETVTLMNGKTVQLTPENIGTSKLLSSNTLTGNGLLFQIDKQMDYAFNLFEYMAANELIDSVGNFLNHFTTDEFYPALSVAGGIEDGKVWYLDSVTYLRNELFSYTQINRQAGLGLIQSEDSFYRMVIPTNDEWNRMVAEYTPYFKYDDGVLRHDSMQWAETRMNILRGTAFSATRNAKKVDNEWKWNEDSVLSYNSFEYTYRILWGDYGMKYYQYSNPANLWKGISSFNCSNGEAIISDNWKIDKRQTFMRDNIIEGENTNRLDSVDKSTTLDADYKIVAATSPYYGKISQNRVVIIRPSGTSASKAWFNVPELLSNVGYDISVVMAPIRSADTTAVDTLPSKFRANISFHHLDGKLSKEYYLPDSTVKASQRVDFESKPWEVDTILLVSDFKLPTCSYGLDDPQVHISLESHVTSSERRNKTKTATMCIDCFLVKPHE